MSEKGLLASQEKMRTANVSETAVKVFTHYYHQLEAGVTGMIPEETIEPLLEVPQLADQQVSEETAKAALGKTAFIKLNGGLGTSMGMTKAKSLLKVRGEDTFLDLICKQIRSARAETGAQIPLIFMNSFNTETDTLEALKAHPDIEIPSLPLSFLQNQEPKLTADTLEPVSYPENPALEWCPPGHGDIYTALLASGILQALLESGYRYMMTSNSDNLGATPDARIAGWFATSGLPYAAELCVRTINDRKGGHLAIRKTDGQLILRDTAQTPPEQMEYFTDEHRHPFFHTNNLWFDLQVLYDTLVAKDAVLGLPLIANEKTVDPKDSSTEKVIQMETSMGSAIASFPGAGAIAVERSRFLPVKTTNELLLVRSDLYELHDNGHLEPVAPKTPEIKLSSEHYKKITDFEARFPEGIPSLRQVESLNIEGDWTLSKTAELRGAVTLPKTDGAKRYPQDA
ncbi:MAG: UTP--glucose-1-phosphate uridylyltransferase [Varibaculum sp.]|nr:UTP--glucose-1-phosphate uridylyltransferase [Varibaculum sp.]